MIKSEQEIKNTFKAKGIITNVDDAGVAIEDEKEGTTDTFDLSIFKKFIGKSITMAIAEKEIKTIEFEEE
jgi:hypothetical protein